MFKYDNRYKNENIRKIIESLKNSRGVLIGTQSAGRIEYLLSQRHFFVDSVEISGKDINTGSTVQFLLNIRELAQKMN
jgi:hypothetical protein